MKCNLCSFVTSLVLLAACAVSLPTADIMAKTRHSKSVLSSSRASLPMEERREDEEQMRYLQALDTNTAYDKAAAGLNEYNPSLMRVADGETGAAQRAGAVGDGVGQVVRAGGDRGGATEGEEFRQDKDGPPTLQTSGLRVGKRFNEFVGKRGGEPGWGGALEGEGNENGGVGLGLANPLSDERDSGNVLGEHVQNMMNAIVEMNVRDQTSAHEKYDKGQKARVDNLRQMYLQDTNDVFMENLKRRVSDSLQREGHVKRQYDFVGKRRPYDFLGKKSYDFLGKKSYDFLGKKSYDFLGKKSYDFLGKKNYDFLGKKSYDFLGKKSYDFLGKRPQQSGQPGYATAIANDDGNGGKRMHFRWSPVGDPATPLKASPPSALRLHSDRSVAERVPGKSHLSYASGLNKAIGEGDGSETKRYAEFLGKRSDESAEGGLSDSQRLAAILSNNGLRKRLGHLLTLSLEGGRATPEFVG